MMTHPLVKQLYFARSEFQRCLDGLPEEDGARRILPMNCISWIVGHLALQENSYWNYLGQENIIYPHLRGLVGSGMPASTPSLAEMQSAWQDITAQANGFLVNLSTTSLQEHFTHKGRELEESIGTMLHRNIYHYWFHTGEAHAIRQVSGHTNLPDFVGNMEGFFYQPE
jgi:hypothetical protein